MENSRLKTMFGDNIRYMRMQNKEPQKVIAALLGIKRCTYSKYEEGVAEASYMTLLNLAGMYSVTVEELLTVDMRKVEGRTYLLDKETILRK